MLTYAEAWVTFFRTILPEPTHPITALRNSPKQFMVRGGAGAMPYGRMEMHCQHVHMLAGHVYVLCMPV